MNNIDIDKLNKSELEDIIFDKNDNVIIGNFSYEDRIKLLNKLRKRELVLVFGSYNMSIDEYIVAIKRLKEVNGTNDNFDKAYSYLEEYIDTINDIKKLKEISKKLKDNNINTNYIEKRINKLKVKKNNHKKDNSLFWGILFAFAFSKNKSKEKNNRFK